MAILNEKKNGGETRFVQFLKFSNFISNVHYLNGFIVLRTTLQQSIDFGQQMLL